MPPCKHYEICGREALDGEGEDSCILHSLDPDKDKEVFERALAEHREGKGDDFSHFVFPRETNFVKAEFSGEANFGGAKFSDAANFWDAKFSGGASFREAEFSGGANFREAEFSGGANFWGAEFRVDADFGTAMFSGDARFAGAMFSGDANFTQAKFRAGAKFRGTEFNADAKFIDAEFGGEANFWSAKFTGATDFWGAKFGGEARFVGAKFGGEASFWESEFRSDVHFVGATFSGRTYFRMTKFSKNVHFKGTEFLGRTLFDYDSQNAETLFGAETYFENAVLEPLNAVTFRNADLRRWIFQGTDLREIEFSNVTWPSKGGRFRVYDEEVELKEGETRDWPHIEQLYRQLKQNYENRKDYVGASDFHYGEKEMRRKNPDTPGGLYFLLTLYWLVSGYGERCKPPLLWATGLLVACAGLYLYLGLTPKNGGPPLTWTNGWDWLEATLYSFRVMTLLKPDDFTLVRLGAKFLYAIQSVLGPILLGLFALAVRQRLKR